MFSFGPDRHIFIGPSGYRWKDISGNWSTFDSDGRLLSHGDRNGLKVSFLYESGDSGKLTGVADNTGRQVLWYEYVSGNVSVVRDISGREVSYNYSGGNLSDVTDVLGNKTFYTYGSGGRLEIKTDPEGRKTTISYDDFGYVESVTDENGEGKFFEYSYNEAQKQYYASIKYSTGKIKEMWFDRNGDRIRTNINGRTVETVIIEGRNRTVIDADGNETHRQYDGRENLVRETYPDDSWVSYQYESKFNNLMRVTDERNVLAVYEYDDFGNRTEKTEAAGTPDERISEYTYDEDGNLKTVKVLGDVRTADAVTGMTYDENGNLETVTGPDGNITSYTYNIMGQVLTRTDPRNKVWTYDYDDMGNLKTVTDPLNHTTQFFYDGAGNKIREIDPDGKITHYAYKNGRLDTVTDHLGNITQFEYDSEGQLKKQTDREGKTVTQDYDLDSRLKKMTDGNGNEIVYDYEDASGSSCSSGCSGGGTDQPSKIIYPTFTREFDYDNRGRKKTETDILSDAVQYQTVFGYDPAGNLTEVTDKENRKTASKYDKLGRKVSVTDSMNGESVYTYDDRDNLISLKDAEGNITWFEYDRNNRLKKEIRPMGEETVYDYDGAGNLVQKTDAMNQKTVYGYDDAGRMKEIRYYAASDYDTPEKTVALDYYPAGAIKSYTDGVTSATYEYDDLHRKISEVVDYGDFTLSFAYAYYKNGLKKSFKGPDGIVYEYTYDNNNQLTGISIPGSGTIAYDSYQWNRPLSVSYPGGVTKTYGYDPLMRVNAITVKDPVQKVLMDYQYAYDKMDNILSKQTEHGDYSYTYDPLYQLKTADNAVLDDEEYAYDKVGNRLTSEGVSGNWTYNDNNELLSYGGYTSDYDANGNMIRKSGNGEVFNYIYNVENRLVRVEKGDGSVVGEYYYDPFGRRLWKDADGVKTFFLYADEGLVGEYDENGAVIKTYGYKPNSVWTTDPVFMKQGSEHYFYQNDHLGTPVQMTDMNGGVVWSVRYDAFGVAEVEGASAVMNNLRLPGQYFDGESGLHYNWYRYYNSDVGRYIRIDPIGFDGGINLFSYTYNNPIVFLDPDGTFAWIILSPCIKGAMTSAVVDVVIQEVKCCWKQFGWRILKCRLCNLCPSINKCSVVVSAVVGCGAGYIPGAPPTTLEGLKIVLRKFGASAILKFIGKLGC